MTNLNAFAVAAFMFYFASNVYAAPENRFYQMSEAEIADSLKAIHRETPELQARVARVSEEFLGIPYRLGPLGEGPGGEFDRFPVIRFDAADCTTMVEEVMALSLESDLNRAKRTLQKIRYKNGEIKYESRNHFTSIDWIPVNAAAGYLKDITRDVAGAKTQTASKIIRKRAWYEAKTGRDLEGFSKLAPKEEEDRVRRWRELGRKFADQEVRLDYLPMSELPDFLAKIPSGTIANLVREDKPEMPDLVSHQVLLIQKDGETFVRHASSSGAVEDAPALKYFYRYFNSKWRLLGLNLNQITEPGKR